MPHEARVALHCSLPLLLLAGSAIVGTKEAYALSAYAYMCYTFLRFELDMRPTLGAFVRDALAFAAVSFGGFYNWNAFMELLEGQPEAMQLPWAYAAFAAFLAFMYIPTMSVRWPR